MRTAKNIFPFVIGLLLFMSSCKKKSDPEPEPEPAPVVTPTIGTMSCKINGAAWTSTKTTAVFQIDVDTDLSAFIINGETAGDLIILGVDFPSSNNTLHVENHDMNLTKDDAVFTYVRKTSGGGTSITDIPDEGTFNITAVDNPAKKVSGNFSCKFHKVGSTQAADSLKITEGVFTNINYTIQQ